MLTPAIFMAGSWQLLALNSSSAPQSAPRGETSGDTSRWNQSAQPVRVRRGPRPDRVSAGPGVRRVDCSTSAEVAWTQASVEPGHEAHDVEDRPRDMFAERACVGRHVGAFEQDRAHVGVPTHEGLAGIEDVALGCGDIEFELVAENGAAELAPAVGAN